MYRLLSIREPHERMVPENELMRFVPAEKRIRKRSSHLKLGARKKRPKEERDVPDASEHRVSRACSDES